MIALACGWGGDLSIGPTGDLGTASVESELRMRILRRLLTNPGDYIWHTEYGAGLANYIGEPYSAGQIERAISDQLRLEPMVAPTPPPVVLTDEPVAGSNTALVNIRYQITGTSTESSAALDLNGS